MAEHHEMMGGRLHVYRRERSNKWQCSTYMDGKNWRKSTDEDSLALAKEFAEDWYLSLKGKHRAGLLKHGKTFRQAAEKFEAEYEVLTKGHRSPRHVEMIKLRLQVHLIPYFGNMLVSEINAGTVQDYRVHRARNPHVQQGRKPESTKPPSRSTTHQEIVIVRQVLKAANRRGWLPYVPDLSAPYKTSGKISHRAWFSPEEYKTLYTATRRKANDPKNKRWKLVNENLHDYVLFMANTGLRPDEAARLEFRDVAIVTDEATGERILEIEVRGKRGIGYCKSMTGAILPFQRLRGRAKPKPTDRIFGKTPRMLLNKVLGKLDLKTDRDGNTRTAYSLRHTYICLRLMEGADIYQIAKNCRTSVEMIEKFYAAHIKNTLDAAAINIRKPKAKPRRRGSRSKPKPPSAGRR